MRYNRGMNKTKTKYARTANPEMAAAFRELRRSNATVPKPARTERKSRSRAGARRAAIAQGW